LIAAMAALVTATTVVSLPQPSRADEGGVSFWLPGLYGSLAAAPLKPGLTVQETYYHWQGSAGADVSAAREITIGRFNPTLNINLSGSINSTFDAVLSTALYTFATPILGGQASVGLMTVYGRNDTSLSAALTGTLGPIPFSRFDSISDSVTGFGDLYPLATLRWNQGVNNFMIYATGDLPVGLYNASSLANIGIGHYAVDAGVGYTYFNPQTGHEFSAVTGLTYNFINPATQYQNGVDWHLDWGASQFLTKEVMVGLVGYFYKEIGCDSGSGDRVGCFQSQVFGIGPQVGFLFPLGTGLQGYLNVKGYKEFDNERRLGGYDVWVSLTISPSGEKPPAARPLIHK
jgi:hypothetical protein